MASEFKEIDEMIRSHFNLHQFKIQEDKFSVPPILEENENRLFPKTAELKTEIRFDVDSGVTENDIINQISDYAQFPKNKYLALLASNIVFASYSEVESELSFYDIELLNKIKNLELTNIELEERVDKLESSVLELQGSTIEQKGFEKSTQESSNIKKLKNSAFNKLLNNDILSYVEKFSIVKHMLQTIDIIDAIFPNYIPSDVHLSKDPEEGSSWVTMELLYGKNLSKSEEKYEIFLKQFITLIPPWAQSLICVIVDPKS